jgi:hypothetical protein
MKSYLLALLVLCLPLHGLADTALPETHPIFGNAETVFVSDHHIKLNARMDTGALTSSLSATHIKVFTKNNKKWVRFTVERKRTDKLYQLELPFVRYADIRKRHADIDDTDSYERRPVVALPVCLGNQSKIIEVSLTNRSHFDYPVLIGRSGMDAFDILIDPHKTFTTSPTCPTPMTNKESAS